MEKETPYGPVPVLRPDGKTRDSVQVHLRQGQPGIVELNANAEPVFTELVRLSTNEVPASHGGGTLMLRLDAIADDVARKFNRAENLRPFSPSDPDYQRLYPRRADAESINRFLDDTCWLGRAHSVGWQGQLLDLVGFGLLLNSVALWRHRRVHAPPAQVAA